MDSPTGWKIFRSHVGPAGRSTLTARSGQWDGDIRMDPRNSRLVQRVRAWPRRVLITVVAIAVVLIGARVALPFVVKRQVNHRLMSIPGYAGQVEGIGISLLRGAYSLDNLQIYKIN